VAVRDAEQSVEDEDDDEYEYEYEPIEP